MQRVLIIGATSAIAEATARRYAQRASSLFLVGRDATRLEAIAAELEGNDEVMAVVTALEQQYDAYLKGQEHPNLWASETSEIPSADELGAEFEEFLRTVSDDDTD